MWTFSINFVARSTQRFRICSLILWNNKCDKHFVLTWCVTSQLMSSFSKPLFGFRFLYIWRLNQTTDSWTSYYINNWKSAHKQLFNSEITQPFLTNFNQMIGRDVSFDLKEKLFLLSSGYSRMWPCHNQLWSIYYECDNILNKIILKILIWAELLLVWIWKEIAYLKISRIFVAFIWSSLKFLINPWLEFVSISLEILKTQQTA